MALSPTMLAGLTVVMLAPFIGSFLGTVIRRMPEGLSVLGGRSYCDHCKHPLGVGDLVPLLSWIVSRATCRYCGLAVSGFYPLVELSALAIALSAVWAMRGVPPWLLAVSCIFGWTLLTLAWIDWRARFLPDLLVLPLAALGLLVACFLPGGPWLDHLIGAVVGYGAMAGIAALYRRWRGRDGLGMGDAKLMGAAGAWLSWQGLPSVLLLGCGGLLLVLLVLLLGGRALRRDEELPLGTALAVAIWIVWLSGPLEIA